MSLGREALEDMAINDAIREYHGGKKLAYEMKDNSGSLFKNDKRETENHPNAKGSALIDGVEYWVAAWTKKDKNGNPWQSLSFQRKDEKTESKPAKVTGGGFDDFKDDIPF